MKEVFIVDAVRTPIGKYGGALASIRPDDMLANVIRALMARNAGIDVNLIEDVIAGDANQAGEDNRNVARMAALLAGLPVSVAGSTVNRLCASGLQAIMDASRAIMCSEGDLYIACGVESMTRAPFVMAKADDKYTRKTEIHDSTIGWRFTNPKLTAKYHPFSMGETAENVARQWKLSREQQDEFALASQQKYFAAKTAGKWNDELIPIEVKPEIVAEDEHPRQTSMEKTFSIETRICKRRNGNSR
jgi:acetyl-CoA C-acetyltransferase